MSYSLSGHMFFSYIYCLHYFTLCTLSVICFIYHYIISILLPSEYITSSIVYFIYFAGLLHYIIFNIFSSFIHIFLYWFIYFIFHIIIFIFISCKFCDAFISLFFIIYILFFFFFFHFIFHCRRWSFLLPSYINTLMTFLLLHI